MTLFDLLQSIPAERTAIVLPDSAVRLTYGALREQIESLNESLAGAGVKRGDRVAIALPNGLPMVVSFFAATMAGTAALLNPAYKEDEFRFYLEDADARVLILSPSGVGAAGRGAGGAVRILTVDMNPEGQVSFGGSPRGAPFPPATSDEIALVLHTSGSTGRPKRVPLAHANLTISALNVARTYRLSPDDVALCVMPLFHVHGLVAVMLATLATGGTLVIPEHFNPLSFRRLVRDYGVTWYSAVPTIHQLLLARTTDGAGPRASHDGRLRFIRSCSAACPTHVLNALEAMFGAPVLEAYGMTEAAHQIASNPLPPAPRKPGSVGTSTDGHISIVDAHGKHLSTGERGEVVIQGPNVMRGYENNPEANATAFVDGWFRTGDQGYLDGDGYLTLVGRSKELINRGGEKIAPHEIDDVLLAHPSVAEAVCFGVPHPAWGEEVAAVVVVRNSVSEAELLAFCKERLADYKRPKEIRIAAAIPRTATGKIQRGAIAGAFAQKLS